MSTKTPILAPSILAADYTQLGKQIDSCIKNGVSWIHCDIMDGHFVPNISFGPTMVEAVNRCGDFLVDVHLMIENPDQYIDNFIDAGADLITVHQETCPHLHRTIQHIKQADTKAGVAINPATPLNSIEPILNDVDLVLIMSVNPGFGGQSFIESTYQRLRHISKLRKQYEGNFLIEVDGGVNPSNIQNISNAGAEVFVTGSAVFKTDDIGKRLNELSEKALKGKQRFV